MAGLIPADFIDELLTRIDIVELIGARVRLRKSGHNYTGLCPFHEERTPSFSVSQDKQFYYCFGCQATGDQIKFLMELDHLDFVEAVETLAERVGLQVPKVESESRPAAGTDQKSLLEMLERAAAFYKEQLRSHPQRLQAVEYLKQRGVTGLIARDFSIGFAPPGWNNLESALGVTNQARQLLIDTGMLIEDPDKGQCRDRFRDRIMFPIRDIRGRVIAFGGRVLGDGTPKYLNSPETALFHKGRELYGLHEARRNNRRLGRLLVVEGYMDVIALAQHGVTCAVATLGTATTAEHVDRLFRLVSEVVFCFDADAAGRKAAWKALEVVLPFMLDGRSVRFMFLPEGEDPDTMIRKVGQQGFIERMDAATHLPEFYFEQMCALSPPDSLEGRARLAKEALTGIEAMPEGALRQLMIDRLSQLTGLERQRLVQVTARERRPPAAVPAAPARRQGRRSTSGAAISLLLRQPELVTECSEADQALLSQPDDEDGRLLHALLQWLRQQESPSPEALLQAFRQDPGFPRLLQLQAAEHLLREEALPEEFRGILGRLVTQARSRYSRLTRDKLLAKPLAELTAEERQILRALHGANPKPKD